LALALNGTAGIRDQVCGQPSIPPSPAAKHPIHAPTPRLTIPRILHILVENQAGLVWERFVTPLLRVKSYDELNAWLLDQCVTFAKAHRHPEMVPRCR
jgi:hypothetical protein